VAAAGLEFSYVIWMYYEGRELMEEPEVKKAKKTTLAERLPKIYKIVGIVFIVFGILILLWSILFTILGYYEILLYLMGILITGFGFWYYFWMSKPRNRN